MAKPQFTVEQVATALTESKGMITVAASKLGCSPTTVHNYVTKYATVRDALDTARNAQLDFTEMKLFEEIGKNNTAAIIFYLKTVGKRRGYVERSEQVNYNIPPELMARFDKLAEQAERPAHELFEDMMNAIAAELETGSAENSS